ncbi:MULTISPECIES: hypothetical protein [unclassified Rhizobium]|jgi:hypothetical protein|uniref:hypothetical protein n=1 Tax=unclassified Rhizobium TaxID=2613769 RepID=UPI003D2853A5
MTQTKQKPTQETVNYTVETFQAAYDLPLAKAAELFSRFGPSSHDLDPLMKAFKNRRAFDP